MTKICDKFWSFFDFLFRKYESKHVDEMSLITNVWARKKITDTSVCQLSTTECAAQSEHLSRVLTFILWHHFDFISHQELFRNPYSTLPIVGIPDSFINYIQKAYLNRCLKRLCFTTEFFYRLLPVLFGYIIFRISYTLSASLRCFVNFHSSVLELWIFTV